MTYESMLRKLFRGVDLGVEDFCLDNPKDTPLHSGLTSARWQYEFARYEEPDGWKIKYWKNIGENHER